MTPRLDGLCEDLPPNRARRAVELVAYLALHQPDGITGDRLRTRVLGSSDADAASKTLFNTAYAARRAMGVDEHGDPLFPAGSRTGLYQVSPHVTVDVHRAIALATEGRSQADPDLAIAHFRAALDLVEGEPLANALSGYSWWEAEGHGGRIAAVLVDAACSMAVLAADAGHFELARWGLERARLVEPYSEALSRAAMQLAAAEGDADRLRFEWRECQRRVDALDPGSSPSTRTESLYGELSRRIHVGARDAPRPTAPVTRPPRATERPPADPYARTTSSRRATRLPLTSSASPGPSVRSSATAAVDVVHLGGAVEVGLVADDLDPELLGLPGHAPVLGLGLGAELGHEAEQGQLPPRPERGQRAQRRLGGGGVGVVAVDDQDGAVRSVVHLHAQAASRSPPASAATTSSKGTPHHSAAAAAASALRDLLHPVQGQPHLPGAPRRGEAEPRAELAVEHDVLGAHLGVAVHRVAEHRAGAARRHVGDPRVVEVQDGDAGRRQGAATSSLFARATPSRSPKYSTWAMATLVTMPTSGRATRASRSMWPTPRAPISSTTHCASSGALRSVRGRPSSLLKERSLAAVRKDRGQAGTEEILGGRLADRPGDPDHAADAAAGQHAEVHERERRVGDPDRRPAERRLHGQVGGGTGIERSGDEGMPVPVCDDRHVELTRRQRPGVDACAVHGDVGPDQLSAEVGCEFRCGESHALPSRPIV